LPTAVMSPSAKSRKGRCSYSCSPLTVSSLIPLSVPNTSFGSSSPAQTQHGHVFKKTKTKTKKKKTKTKPITFMTSHNAWKDTPAYSTHPLASFGFLFKSKKTTINESQHALTTGSQVTLTHRTFFLSKVGRLLAFDILQVDLASVYFHNLVACLQRLQECMLSMGYLYMCSMGCLYMCIYALRFSVFHVSDAPSG
jgi:hypothetical protein